MAEKLEDFNLPFAVVTKIIKEAVPDVNISKDARTAIARAGSVFILYLTTHAFYAAQKVNRKTLTGPDIIEAMENLEFDELVEPLKKYLAEYKEQVKKTKAEKSNKKVDEGETPADEEAPAEEEDDEDEDEEAPDESENMDE